MLDRHPFIQLFYRSARPQTKHLRASNLERPARPTELSSATCRYCIARRESGRYYFKVQSYTRRDIQNMFGRALAVLLTCYDFSDLTTSNPSDVRPEAQHVSLSACYFGLFTDSSMFKSHLNTPRTVSLSGLRSVWYQTRSLRPSLYSHRLSKQSFRLRARSRAGQTQVYRQTDALSLSCLLRKKTLSP